MKELKKIIRNLYYELFACINHKNGQINKLILLQFEIYIKNDLSVTKVAKF